MITLYAKSGCGYCKKVIDVLDLHGISFIKLNVRDEAIANELIEKGGKLQMPYMLDGNVAMYESDAIVDYIEKTYGGEKSASKIKVHFASGTSSVCT